MDFKVTIKDGKIVGYSASGNYSQCNDGNLSQIYSKFENQVQQKLVEFGLQRFIEPKMPEPPTPTQIKAWGLINALPEEKIFYSPGVGGIGDFIVEKINKENALKIKVAHYEYPYKNGGLLITDYANGVPF